MLILIVGCALAGCAAAGDVGPRDSAGVVTAKATIDTYSLTVGDCTGPIAPNDARSFTVVPCTQKHNWEAFARTTLDDASFPGQKAVSAAATDFCDASFATFIGVKRTKSAYQLTILQPTKDTWDNFGDREVMCLTGQSSSSLKGTLEGAERPTPTPQKEKR